MDKNERINKIANMIKNPSAGGNIMAPTQIKVGVGMNYFLFDVGKDSIGRLESHIDSLGNPGFTFTSTASELRTGEKLFMTTKLSDITFGNGMSVNPKAQFLPPNIVNFYMPMLPSIGQTTYNVMFASVLGL